MLPEAELVILDSPRAFFRRRHKNLDAFVFTAEAGSAWCLVYPAFSVAVPEPGRIRVPLAYPVRLGETGFIAYLNTWLDLKQKDGTIETIFDHWILGKDAQPHVQRWSVIRNVLGWME